MGIGIGFLALVRIVGVGLGGELGGAIGGPGPHIGEEIVLNEPISDGFGRVPIGDTVWRVAGPDLPAGRKVRIVGHDGAVLKVEAA